MSTFIGTLLIVALSSMALANDSVLLTVPFQVDDPVILDLSYINISHKNVSQDQTEYSELLQVYVGNSEGCCANKSPVVGSYEAYKASVKFIPRFGFEAGQDYVVRVRQKSKNTTFVYQFTEFYIEPNTPIVKPEVLAIYPSGDMLPENLLRFYIHFSRPMKAHVAYKYIQLVDTSGNADNAAFMIFKQELWSEDRKRLTLLMDPGRIKRGVATNLTLGPALIEGSSYKLVVNSDWPTATGNETLLGFSKHFFVSHALRELPNVDRWKLTIPTLGTTEMLKIKFDRPFDHQLLQKHIQLYSVDRKVINGDFVIGNHETEWHFLPNDSWVDARIFMEVNGELEDVSGNNFKDLLDHHVGAGTKDISYISLPIDLNHPLNTLE